VHHVDQDCIIIVITAFEEKSTSKEAANASGERSSFSDDTECG